MAAGIPAFLRDTIWALALPPSRSGLTRAHVKHRKEKGIDIPQFINHFASRLAKAMAGVLFHTQHNGIHPGIGGLQGCGKFQRV